MEGKPLGLSSMNLKPKLFSNLVRLTLFLTACGLLYRNGLQVAPVFGVFLLQLLQLQEMLG